MDAIGIVNSKEYLRAEGDPVFLSDVEWQTLRSAVLSQQTTNSAMDAICTCTEAICRYRSATELKLCLDPTGLCKYKQHQ